MLLNGKYYAIPPIINLNNVDTTRTLKNDSVWFPYLVEQASAEEQEFVKDMTEDIKIPRHKQVESVAVYVTINSDKLKRVHTVLMVRITTTDGKQYPNCIAFTAEKSQEQAVTILEKFFQAGAPGMNPRIAARQSAFFEKCTTPSENEKADRVIAYLKSGMSVDEVIALLNQ